MRYAEPVTTFEQNLITSNKNVVLLYHKKLFKIPWNGLSYYRKTAKKTRITRTQTREFDSSRTSAKGAFNRTGWPALDRSGVTANNSKTTLAFLMCWVLLRTVSEIQSNFSSNSPTLLSHPTLAPFPDTPALATRWARTHPRGPSSSWTRSSRGPI